MKYSIIIPCYNEGESLLELVKVLKKFPKKYKVEFILVENGSKDNSREIFEKKLKLDDKHIRKVYVNNNQGYGYGIIQGLKKAKGEYVGWLHADLQYNPLDLVPFFDYIEQHPNEKLLMKGKRKNRTFIEHFFTFGMGIYESLLFRKHMTNVMAMPVIFNKELIKNHKDFPYDFSIDIYTYALALKEKYNVVHLPIIIQERKKGVSSWNTGIVSRIKLSKKMMTSSIIVKNKLKDK